MADSENKSNNLSTIAVIVIAVVMVGGFLMFSAMRGDQGGSDVQGTSAPLAQVVDGKQKAAVTVGSSGYSPRTITLKRDVPVELTFLGQGYGCATAVVSRDFWDGIKEVGKGETVAVNFTPTKTGKFKYTCTMGMYTGWIEVV